MNSFLVNGIVLKRSNIGELDRIVTLFTKEQGKLVCIAKGSRKLTSSKLAALEPGCLIKLQAVKTRSLPILTQAQIVDDFASLKSNLPGVRNLFQILEMLDAVLAEEDPQPEVFDISLHLLNRIGQKETNKTWEVRSAFTKTLALLGFAAEDTLSTSLRDCIENLTQRKLKAFAYLSQT